MKFELKTIEQRSPNQPENSGRQYIRKNWTIFFAYYLVTSLTIALVISAVMFLFVAFDRSKSGKPLIVHDILLFCLAVVGILIALIFLIQLITGPFVFTKNVVCRNCHMRLKVNRIPFFRGKYSGPVRCQCGGKIEPAFLWEEAN